jgi:hypothetical protein
VIYVITPRHGLRPVRGAKPGRGRAGRCSDAGPMSSARRRPGESISDHWAPPAVLLGRYLPGRVRHVFQTTAAARVLIDSGDAAQRRLIAGRGACSLPTGRCFVTPDSRLPSLPKVATSRSSTRSSRTPASAAVRVHPTEQ